MRSDSQVIDVGKPNPAESHSNVSLVNYVVHTALQQSRKQANQMHAWKWSSYCNRGILEVF